MNKSLLSEALLLEALFTPPPPPPPLKLFCDFQFILICRILRNLQGSAALGSPAVDILLKAPENFRKFTNFVQISHFLYSCHVAVF